MRGIAQLVERCLCKADVNGSNILNPKILTPRTLKTSLLKYYNNMKIFRAASYTAHNPGNRPRALHTSLLKQDNAMEIFRAAYNTAHTPGNRRSSTIQMYDETNSLSIKNFTFLEGEKTAFMDIQSKANFKPIKFVDLFSGSKTAKPEDFIFCFKIGPERLPIKLVG